MNVTYQPIEAQAQSIEAARDQAQATWSDAWLTADDQRAWRV